MPLLGLRAFTRIGAGARFDSGNPGLPGYGLSMAGSEVELGRRLDSLPWKQAEEELDTRGHALLGPVLSPADCASLVQGYEADLYRKRIVMDAHNYGGGEYKYYRYPLPELVKGLREALYVRLLPVANRWAEALGQERRYPSTLSELSALCRAQGQERPTPLILRYERGGYNRLHQDMYGAVHFPLQVVILLSRPGEDFTGGQIVLTEQRPRVQARAYVVTPGQGEALVFASNRRPTEGKRGYVGLTMRHGVSDLASGERFTLGIIFHDAE